MSARTSLVLVLLLGAGIACAELRADRPPEAVTVEAEAFTLRHEPPAELRAGRPVPVVVDGASDHGEGSLPFLVVEVTGEEGLERVRMHPAGPSFAWVARVEGEPGELLRYRIVEEGDEGVRLPAEPGASFAVPVRAEVHPAWPLSATILQVLAIVCLLASLQAALAGLGRPDAEPLRLHGDVRRAFRLAFAGLCLALPALVAGGVEGHLAAGSFYAGFPLGPWAPHTRAGALLVVLLVLVATKHDALRRPGLRRFRLLSHRAWARLVVLLGGLTALGLAVPYSARLGIFLPGWLT